MRNSKQKNLILNIVNNNRCHFNAEQIYLEARKTISDISLGTVYRNLNNLVLENKIRRIKMEDGTDRFDHNNDFHEHFICRECNSIIDVKENKKNLPKSIDGNQVISYEVTYKGICKKCLKEGEIVYGIKRK